MRVETDDLYDVARIAERLGIGQSTVSNWANRHDDYPVPVIDLGPRRKMWLWWQVEAWHRHHTGRDAI